MKNILVWSNENSLEFNSVLRMCKKHKVVLTKIGNAYLAESDSLASALAQESVNQAVLAKLRSERSKQRNFEIKRLWLMEAEQASQQNKNKEVS